MKPTAGPWYAWPKKKRQLKRSLPLRPDPKFVRYGVAAAFLTLALAACSAEKEPAQEPVAETDTVAFPAADGGPSTGRFEISSPTGDVVIVQEVRADGTYSSTLGGQPTESGTWTVPSPGLFCTEANGNKSCDEETIGPDGTWYSVNVEDASNRWIIRRLPDEKPD